MCIHIISNTIKHTHTPKYIRISHSFAKQNFYFNIELIIYLNYYNLDINIIKLFVKIYFC
jgi:hypothetical protein